MHAETHHSPAVELPMEPVKPEELQPEPEMLLCQWCYLEHAASELLEHADYCGSRTERCDSCFRFVQLRYFADHSTSGCSLDAAGGSFPSLRETTNTIDTRARESSLSYDGSGGTSPLDVLICSGSERGDDGVAVCPYCDEACEAAEGEDKAAGAAAALASHLALTNCAEAFAMQQLTGSWKARAEAAGQVAKKPTKKAAKKAAAAVRRKQQHLAAEYEAQAIHMSPMGSFGVESAMLPAAAAESAGGVSVGGYLDEALRSQEERVTRLRGDESDDGEMLFRHDDDEEEQEPGAADGRPTNGVADEESSTVMARYYGHRAVEPELTSFYFTARHRKERAADVHPHGLFGAECPCEVCGRAVALAELEDHTMAYRLSGTPGAESPEVAAHTEWGGFDTLSPKTISVHRSQYDNGVAERFSRRRSAIDQELWYRGEMETCTSGGKTGGGKKAKGKNGRRRGGGGSTLLEEAADARSTTSTVRPAMVEAEAESAVDAREGARKKGKRKRRNCPPRK